MLRYLIFAARRAPPHGLWPALLAPGRHSRIFQDMTVFDILDTGFAAYQSPGKLASARRLDILDRTIYPKRSITTQYQKRPGLCQAGYTRRGLLHYLKHAGDSGSPAMGSHTMVIADHNRSFEPNAQASIAYTQPGTIMVRNSMDRRRTICTCGLTADLSNWHKSATRAATSMPIRAKPKAS